MQQVFCVPDDSDRLNLPSVLVLNSCGITCAGDEREIAAFCAHVSELDLSDNKLQDWHEVKSVSPYLGKASLTIISLLILLYIPLTLVVTRDSGHLHVSRSTARHRLPLVNFQLLLIAETLLLWLE